jgi:hypothetical protein
MSDQMIKHAAATERKWKEADLEVSALGAIELPPCRFFSVANKAQIADAALYAMLPSGEVVGQGDRAAADKIIAACGKAQISANAAAEVLARFHWDVGPGQVVYKNQAPPQLSPQGKLRFSLKNYETSKLYEISATIAGGKISDISKQKIE